MAHLRTWAEWEALEGADALTPAERHLVDCSKTGEGCILGDGTRPDAPSPERSIRAALLRYLILGGCDACRTDERGVQLMGAYVSGTLDLSFGEARGQTTIVNCQLAKKLEAMQARLNFLNLAGSAFPGLFAEGAVVTGSIFLRAAQVEGEISLSGARINGQLDCDSLKLKSLEAGKMALIARRMHVCEGIFLRGARVESGVLYLASAHAGNLTDDLGSWPDGGNVYIDGFTYNRISPTFLDLPDRLEWLHRGSRWNNQFFPQPYTQLAKVLREMGHDSAARKVLMERERLIRQQARADAAVHPTGDFSVALNVYWADFSNLCRWAKDITLRRLTGYGYAPGRSLVALLILFLAAAFLADRAWTEGSFAPNSGPVLVSEDWKAYDARDCLSLGAAPGCLPNPAASWSAAGAHGADWDSFNPLGYAADLVIPILDLGQTAAWAPSKDRGAWGWGLWWGRWLLSALGWIVTALGAAALTGIIRQDRG